MLKALWHITITELLASLALLALALVLYLSGVASVPRAAITAVGIVLMVAFYSLRYSRR